MACTKVPKSKSYNHTNIKKVLCDWLQNKGDEVQLDGAQSYQNNQQGWVYFIYNKQYFKLNGDTKEEAVKKFCELYESYNGDPDLIFVQHGNYLRLNDKEYLEGNGWYCYQA